MHLDCLGGTFTVLKQICYKGRGAGINELSFVKVNENSLYFKA